MLILGASTTLKAAERVQEFQLVAGWNAIYLDVDPLDDSVEASFSSTLVDVVARYFVPSTPVRFIEESGEEPWNTEGWSVWYSSRRAESFLSSLHAVHGGAAYLVHAVKAGTLSIRGEVVVRPSEWKTDSFNLTGFPVESQGLTFAQYFAGAENRIGTRVYRLSNGNWQKVTNLTNTQIRPGEACWVYCDGSTSYPGPLELLSPGTSGALLSERAPVVTVKVRNRVNAPFTVQAQIEDNSGLPLYFQTVDVTNLATTSSPFQGVVSLGNLSPGAAATLRLELRPEFQSTDGGTANLKLTTSHGIVLRLPIHQKAD